MKLLTVVIPTIRPSVFKTLRSMLDHMDDDMKRDTEIMVVIDGWKRFSELEKEMLRAMSENMIRLVENEEQQGCWGYTAFQQGIDYATGKWVMMMGDDDWFTNDGIVSVYKACLYNRTNTPMIFHMYRPIFSDIIPYQDKVMLGNVGLQMFVFPNNCNIGKVFHDRYESDFFFIQDTIGLNGGTVQWQDEIICVWGRKDRVNPTNKPNGW